MYKTDRVIVGRGADSFYVQIRQIEKGKYIYRFIKADIVDEKEAMDMATKLARKENVPLIDRV